MTVPVRQRSQKITSATFTSTGGRSVIQRITSLQPLRLANGPVRPKSALWRRPQCPGIGTHSRAFPNFPWQFTLENCQSATGVTAIINRQALRIATYSLNPLCS